MFLAFFDDKTGGLEIFGKIDRDPVRDDVIAASVDLELGGTRGWNTG